jgi:hypothetical protein
MNTKSDHLRKCLKSLAPQSGYVSNSYGSGGPLIEPSDVHRFQSDSSAPPTPVHGGHPAWACLELASVARLTSGAVIRP